MCYTSDTKQRKLLNSDPGPRTSSIYLIARTVTMVLLVVIIIIISRLFEYY